VVFPVPAASVNETLLLLESCETMEAAGLLAAVETAAAVIALLNCLPTD